MAWADLEKEIAQLKMQSNQYAIIFAFVSINNMLVVKSRSENAIKIGTTKTLIILISAKQFRY